MCKQQAAVTEHVAQRRRPGSGPELLRRRVACLAALVVTLFAPPLRAQDGVSTQVTRDGSVGPDASVQPIRNSNPEDPLAGLTVPEQLGVRLGSDTVLHSFSRFDVAAGDVVIFTNDFPDSTGQVIARVTGGLRSDIFGVVRTLPGDRLFLLNPAGFLVGPGAMLNADSQLTLSTASELRFAAGERLSASADPAVPVLSTTRVSGFGFPAGGSSGSIVIDGATLTGGLSSTEFATAPLGIALIAADPDLPLSSGAKLASGPGGSVSILGATFLAADVDVVGRSIDIRGSEVSSFLTRLRSLNDLHIADSAIATSIGGFFPTGEPALRLSLEAGSSIVVERTRLNADSFEPAFGRLPGGGIDFAEREGFGAAFNQETLPFFLQLIVGDVSGDVLVRAPSVRIDDSTITTALSNPSVAASQSRASRIDVSGERVVVTGGSRLNAIGGLFAGGGEIRVSASEWLEIDDSILSVSSDQNVAGDILLSGPRVRLLSARVSSEASISAQPNPLVERTIVSAGSIRIDADSLEIRDSDLTSSLRPFDAFVRDFGSTDASAGDIELRAGDVRIAGSNLSTTVDATRSDRLGSIRIDAERLRIEAKSSLSSAALEGDAGSVSIRARELSLDDAKLTSTAARTGAAGAVRIEAERLILSGGSQIATEAQLGPPPGEPAEGSIEITARESVLLEGGSTISASVHEGQGGDVRIGLPRSVVLRDGSRILATTDDGNGGRIDIQTDVFLSDAASEVSADAGVGTSGSVAIRSPDVDLQGSISPLSLAFLNAAGLLRPSCEARVVEGETGSLHVARQAGMPASPEELLLAFDSPDGVPQPDVSASADAAASHVLLKQAQSQQVGGAYAESLETLKHALARAEPTPKGVQLAALLAASGNAQQALGRGSAAELLLSRGGSLAREERAGRLASRIQNDLGNHYAAGGEPGARARELRRGDRAGGE